MKTRTLHFVLNTILILFLIDLNALPSVPSYNSTKKHSLQAKDPKIRAVISKLNKVPGSQVIIAKALQEGPINVDLSFKEMPFGAMWENSMRKISIDGRAQKDPGKLLCYILFELHNAASESKYQELYGMVLNGTIDCDFYVETIEKIEHKNMIDTVAILEKGIALSIFPLSARWEIIHDFTTHYKIQQLTGHSLLIADEYQEMQRKKDFSAYQGTVKDLKKMSESEKKSLAELLYTRYFQSQREMTLLNQHKYL